MTGRLATLGDILMRSTVKKSADESADNVQTYLLTNNDLEDPVLKL